MLGEVATRGSDGGCSGERSRLEACRHCRRHRDVTRDPHPQAGALDLRPGDWILIHVGFALSKIDEAEAKASLEWLTGVGDAYTDELDALRASDIT